MGWIVDPDGPRRAVGSAGWSAAFRQRIGRQGNHSGAEGEQSAPAWPARPAL